MSLRPRFAVVVVNPPEFAYDHFHYDNARYLASSLRGLGYTTALLRNRLEPGAVNIVLGLLTFRDREQVKLLLGGHRYIHFHAELVTGRSINHSGDELHFQTVAMPIFEGAEAVWCWSAEERDTVAALGVRSEVIRFGYSPDLEEVPLDLPRSYEACFFGSTRGDRAQYLDKLTARGLRLKVMFDHHALYRNDTIARSAAGLNLRHGAHMSQLPIYRILYLVNNRRLVVGQTGTQGAHLEALLLHDPARDSGEALLDLIEESVRRPDAQAIADERYDLLRTMPMTAFVAEALERTLTTRG